MEVFVSCCIAAFTATAVFGWLLLTKDAPRIPFPERLHAWGGHLRLVVEGMGSAVCQAGLPSRVRDGLSAELRALAVRGALPFAALGDEACVGTVVAGSMIAMVLLGVLSWSPLGAVVGLAIPPMALLARSHMRARASKTRVGEAMPEAFGALAISLGSGLSLAQAMHYVGSHAEEPVRSEFLRVSFAISCGVSATEALDAMVDRLEAPGLEMVSLALKISQRTGAPLKDLLAEAAQLASDRIELARHLDVKTSQARLSAQLVAVMPMAMTALLSLFSSDFRRGLSTSTGMASVCLALALNVAAWAIIRRIMSVDLS